MLNFWWKRSNYIFLECEDVCMCLHVRCMCMYKNRENQIESSVREWVSKKPRYRDISYLKRSKTLEDTKNKGLLKMVIGT